MKQPNVIAAIPAYNNADDLRTLLPQVLEQNYPTVFVMDDASDDHTPDVLRDFTGDIKVLAGKENLGPAANRNKVMYPAGDSVIHFFDADTTLNSQDNPEIIKELFNGLGEVGYVGGMVRNPSGIQMPANFGPRFGFRSQWIEQSLQGVVYEIGRKNPRRARMLRAKLDLLLKDWPGTETEPEPELVRVYGATEANLIIQSRIFQRVGGFNSKLRYFEAAELAIRLDRAGLPRYFYPPVDVTHNEEIGMAEGIKRLPEMVRWSIPVIGSLGVKEYFLPAN